MSGFPNGTREMGLFPCCFTSTQPSKLGEHACLCARNIPTECGSKTPSLFKASSSRANSSAAPILLYVLHHSVPFSESSNSLSPLVSSFHLINILGCLCLKNDSVGSTSLTDSRSPSLMQAVGWEPSVEA